MTWSPTIRSHNEANGEGGQDGTRNNLSWNCGHEGTDDPELLGVRKRQMRNFLATLFLSQGVPMLAAGDEFARTQRGNNNAYCQDNEISWVDWSLLAAERGPGRFRPFGRELAPQSCRIPPRDVPQGRRLAGRGERCDLAACARRGNDAG